MRVVFFGTAAFAVPSLEKLVSAGHEIVLVVTQPDRRRGRGLHAEPSPVKQAAERLNLALAQPERLTSDVFRGISCEIGVLAAYGKLISESVLSILPQGILGVHPSLLPKYRGAAPVAWALLNGETVTGVSIYRLVKQLDAGDVLRIRDVPIEPRENAQQLTDRLAPLGAEELVHGLEDLRLNRAQWIPQEDAQATFAGKLTKEQGRLDWSRPSETIVRQVRALVPWPATVTAWAGKPVKIWAVEKVDSATGSPGSVLAADSEGIVVAAGLGAVRVMELQPAAGRRMSCREFLAGHRVRAGDRFGT